MAEIRASMMLENSDDRAVFNRGYGDRNDIRRTWTEGIINTGGVSLMIPEEIARKLGLQHEGTREVVYSDERRDERPVAHVTITLLERTTWTEAVIGPEGSQLLIGQVVLDLLDLIPDCRNRKLTARHPDGPLLAMR